MSGAQTFDTVKVGVCDCFWRPIPTTTAPNPDEIFLGLTKGGCELAYTPEYHEINVDQFGKSVTESVLIGEEIKVKIPLAETDLAKLKLFSHTGRLVTDGAKEKLTFGRRPGLRLAALAGQIRLHPIAMAGSHEEDVIIYKAVNKSPLQLNYKLDEERIYSTEFNGLVERLSQEAEIANEESGFLWQIGDPTVGTGASVDTIPILAPTVRVSDILFTDTDSTSGQIGGVVSWTPPLRLSNVDSYEIYTSNNGTTKLNKLGSVPVGTNTFTIVEDTVATGVTHLAVYAKNNIGEAAYGQYVAITDTVPPVVIPTDVVSAILFTDTDTGVNEIGGNVSWTPPASVANVASYEIYTSGDGTTKLTHLGSVAVGTNVFAVPADTSSAGVTHLAVYTKNTAGECLTGTYVAITDVTV